MITGNCPLDANSRIWYGVLYPTKYMYVVTGLEQGNQCTPCKTRQTCLLVHFIVARRLQAPRRRRLGVEGGVVMGAARINPCRNSTLEVAQSGLSSEDTSVTKQSHLSHTCHRRHFLL